MTDIIVVFVLLLVAGGAGLYLFRAKKRGEKCIGCPYAKQCGRKECSSDKTEK